MKPPLVIAHRGASRDAPENTLAAFQLAWQQGADAVETDLHLTADDHIVAIHDADGRRTLNDRRTVRSMTLAEIRRLDAGAWRHRQWRGERVPTLEEIFATFPANRRLVLELKENLCAPLAAALAHAPKDRITIIAFDAPTIAEAKERLPACQALWLFNDYSRISEKQRGTFLATRVKELGVDGVDLRHEYRLTADVLQPLQADLRTIFAYTINHASDARRCAELGIHGITTDRPGEARRWLGISA